MKGKLIFLFGIDGSGKSTILEMLENSRLENTLCTSCLTNAVFEEELFCAEEKLNFSRKEYFSHEFKYVLHINSIIYKMFNTILPILNSGKNVILDRYTVCVKLYGDLFLESSYKCMSRALDCLPSPDLGIYFDASIDTAISRIEIRSNKTGMNPHFSESEKSLVKKKEKYESIIYNEKYAVYKIDANQNIGNMYSSVLKILSEEGINRSG